MSDAEHEYVAAKAAYDAALARLRAAKKARPPQTPKADLRREANKRVAAAIWQAYQAGNHDYRALAAAFDRSHSWVGEFIRSQLYYERFGPETPVEYERRLLVDRVRQAVAEK